MYSICVKGTVFRPLVITENHLILSYTVENTSNVIFPKKEIPIAFHLQEVDISVDEALEIVEQTLGKPMELFIQFPKIGPIYKVDLVQSKLF